MPDFPNGTPRREDLDAIVPDRPGLPAEPRRPLDVGQQPRPRARGNRRLDTPDPDDGRIERDPDGTPTGTLHEGAADLVERLLPAHTDDEWLEAFRTGQAYLHSLGITAWQDAIVPPDYLATYRRAAETGLLTARVEAALWWERERGLEQVEEFVARSRDRLGRAACGRTA